MKLAAAATQPLGSTFPTLALAGRMHETRSCSDPATRVNVSHHLGPRSRLRERGLSIDRTLDRTGEASRIDGSEVEILHVGPLLHEKLVDGRSNNVLDKGRPE